MNHSQFKWNVFSDDDNYELFIVIRRNTITEGKAHWP